jgi:hypothetical protein
MPARRLGGKASSGDGMASRKKGTKKTGPRFLRDAFALEQSLLQVQLELSRQSVTQSGVLGEVNENRFVDVLRRYLPRRYAVDTGIVLDSLGNTSDQIDVIIYDNQYTPTLLDQENHRFIPAEAVYAVFEVKPAINKTYLEYAADKAESVRKLKRTSVPIVYAGGKFPSRPLFTIVAGIVATDLAWKQGFDSRAFARAIGQLTGLRFLDTGLAVSGGCFDYYDGRIKTGPGKNALTFFLFRFLQKLQMLGTAPAVDWSAYGSALSK